MSAVEIGPFVLGIERFAVLLGAAVFLVVAEVLGRITHARSLGSWASSAAFGGFIGARLGHVVQYSDSFAVDPLRVFAIWQDGFSAVGAAVVVGIVTARALSKNLPFAPAAGALWAGVMAWQVVLLDVAQPEPVALPTQQFSAVTDKAVALQSLAHPNTPLIINLWATWCPPCRRELPLFERVAAEQTDVAFVFASQRETAQTVASYLARENVQLSNVLIDSEGQLAQHYGTLGLPVTLFVGGDGLLRHTHVGEISQEVLLDQIRRLQQ